MWILAIALTVLAVVCSIGSLVCFISVVVRMFRNEQAGLGWTSIILTFITGIGPLIAFVVGCMNWTQWKLSKVMLSWLSCIAVGTISGTAAAFLWISVMVNAVDTYSEGGEKRSWSPGEPESGDWLGTNDGNSNEWSNSGEPDEAAQAAAATKWIDKELSYPQIEKLEQAVSESHLDARLNDELESDNTPISRFVELLKHDNPAVRKQAALRLNYRRKKAKDELPNVIDGLSQALFDENLIVRRYAANALVAYGKDAAPAVAPLTKTLRSHDGQLAASAATALAIIGPAAKDAVPDLMEELRRGRYFTLGPAARALSAMGPDAQSAIPLLARKLSGNIEVGRALGVLGAKDELLAAFKDKESSKRKSAIVGLSHLRPTTVEIVHIIGSALQDKNEWVREQAVEELGNIDPKLAEALPYLTAAVSNKDDDIRRHATKSLSKFKIDPKTRLLAMLPQLNDESDYGRHNAETAIKKTGKDAIPILISVIDDKTSTVSIRGNAASALYLFSSMKEDKAVVAPVLKRLASDEKEHIDVRAAAAIAMDRRYYGDNALSAKVRDPILIEAVTKSTSPAIRKAAIGRIQSHAIKAAVPALIAALGDKSKEVVSKAAWALGSMRENNAPIAPKAVVPLLNALKANKAKSPSTIVRALGNLGPAASAAVPEIVRLLGKKQEDDYSLHELSVWAIAQIQADSPQLPATLGKYLRHTSSSVRDQAAESLGELGAKAKSQTRALVAAMRDKDDNVRASATKALGQIGADPAMAASSLLRLLKEEDSTFQQRALTALGQVRPAAAQAIPAIVPFLGNTDEYTRRAAAGALAAYGAEAKPAVKQLIKALDDPNENVRAFAAAALGNIGPPAKEAIPKLIERIGAAEYSYSEERISAAGALLGFVSTDEAAKKWFVSALDNTEDRSTVEYALKAMGKDAVPRLNELLASDDAALRLRTIQLLSTLGDSSAFIPTFKQALKDDDASVRGAAALALSKHDVKFDKSLLIPAHIAGLASGNRDDVNKSRQFLYSLKRKAVPALAAVIANEKAPLAQRKAAANFLSSISRYSRKALPSLEKALDSPVAEIRIAAATTISNIAPKRCPVDVLAEGLQHDDDEIRSAALDASYAIIGSDQERTRTLVPVLIALLKHEERGTRSTAGHVLSNISLDPSTVPALLELMKDPETQQGAVLALSSIREKSEPIIVALTSALTTKDQKAAQSAVWQLSGAKKLAVPHLIRLVKTTTEPARARARACQALGLMLDDGRSAGKTLIAALDDDDAQVRLQAAVAIGRMGGANKAVLKLLLEGLKSKNYDDRQGCSEALVAAKKRAGPATDQLVAMLADEDERVRSTAASLVAKVVEPDVAVKVLLKAAAGIKPNRGHNEMLSALTQVGKPGVEPLVKMLNESDAETQVRILSTLGMMGQQAAAASPAMLKLLESENDAVAERAAIEVTFVDRKAAAAVPKLVQTLKSEDRKKVGRVIAALGNLGEASKPALPAMTDLLKKKQYVWNLLGTVGNLGPAGKDAIPTLIELVDHKNYGNSAIRALGEIGPPAGAAVPSLIKALDNENLRNAAAIALGKIGGEAKQAVPKLLADFDDEFAKYDAARALGQMKEAAADAVPQLAAALTSDDAEFRETVAIALAELGKTAAPAVPALVAALDDADLARLAVNALWQIGPQAKPAVPKLIAMLKTTKPQDNRTSAIHALGRIGPAASPAVPDLINALADDKLQYAAARALGNMGPTAEPAVPALIRLLQQQKPSYAAIQALGQLGTVAVAAEPHLTKLLDDENKSIRLAAKKALAKIRGEKEEIE